MKQHFQLVIDDVRKRLDRLEQLIHLLESFANSSEAPSVPVPAPVPAPALRKSPRKTKAERKPDATTLADKLRAYAADKADGFKVKDAAEALGCSSNDIAKACYWLVRRNQFVKTGYARYTVKRGVDQAYKEFRKSIAPATPEQG